MCPSHCRHFEALHLPNGPKSLQVVDTIIGLISNHVQSASQTTEEQLEALGWATRPQGFQQALNNLEYRLQGQIAGLQGQVTGLQTQIAAVAAHLGIGNAAAQGSIPPNPVGHVGPGATADDVIPDPVAVPVADHDT